MRSAGFVVIDGRISTSKRMRSRLCAVHRLCRFLCIEPGVPAGWPVAWALGRVLLPRLSGTLLCPTTLGFDLCVSEGMGENYYYNGFYEPGTLQVMLLCLREGDVYVDVGASVGQMTLFAAHLVGDRGRVLAFEPHPVRYSNLTSSIAASGRKNITTWQKGLGARSSTSPLYFDSGSPSMLPRNPGGRHVSVDVEPLDTILKDEGVSDVRMLKIDVEGLEAEVLRGASDILSSPNSPIVCFEHGERLDGETALALLREMNDYSFFKPRHSKYYPSKLCEISTTTELGPDENVFCFLDSHIESLPRRLFG
jgi:FkbM family methyltransferase